VSDTLCSGRSAGLTTTIFDIVLTPSQKSSIFEIPWAASQKMHNPNLLSPSQKKSCFDF
jgi:hypothetical protein